MRKVLRRAAAVYLLIGLFFAGMGILIVRYAAYGSDWVMFAGNRHLYSEGRLKKSGTIYDRDGNILSQTVNGEIVYNEDVAVRSALMHLVGDTEQYVSTSIQRNFTSNLAGYNIVNGIHTLADNDTTGNIHLTVNSAVAAAAYEALGNHKGAVAVYNYKTGEIICLVSTPTYDPQNKPEISDDDEAYTGVYLNRTISSTYTPGSIFKLVTAAAAIENIPDIFEQNFHCSGSVEVGGGTVICHGVHGTLDFEDSLAASCNVAFANIALQLGKEKLTAQAQKMGFEQSLDMDGIRVAKGSFDLSNADDLALAWAGVGQYTTLVSPFQMMTAMGAIANGGSPIKPYVVSSVTNAAGITTHSASTQTLSPMISTSAAATLADMMRHDVEYTYGTYNFPGLDLCAKTGTAEVGSASQPHSWFTGFIRNPECPLAFAVIVENDAEGVNPARKITNIVLQKALEVLV